MDLDLLWKSVLIVLGGTLLLRVAGRKSISQMTLAQVVIMVGIGSLLVQPLVGKSVWSTLFVGLLLVCTLVVIEYSQIKFDFIEKFITGQAKALIINGQIQKQTLKKLRLTVDQLEMKLRQSQVSSISDVKEATLEPSGQLGFVLKQNKQNVTKEDIQTLNQEIQSLKQMFNIALTGLQPNFTPQKPSPMQSNLTASTMENNIFDEVSSQSHTVEPPDELQ
jgi:uncharacterized membrane protein YcaP (DUF421 family)